MRYNHQHDMDIMFTVQVNTEVLPISVVAFLSSSDFFRKIGFITTDFIRERPSEIGRGMTIIQEFMLNKFKREDIFFIGGGYSNPELCYHLKNIKEANNYLLSLFNTYCKEHKIKIVLNSEEYLDELF